MKAEEIPAIRLHQQQIVGRQSRTPAEVVAALGAMQAQDYLGALWSVGLRTPEATEASVEKALADGTIVRTWPMRGTLHFVAPADVRWMLELLTPRIIAGSATRQRQLELDAAVFTKCEKIFVQALQGNRQLTREAMMALLEDRKITTAGQRGYHILWRLAQEQVLVFGPRSGKAQTFALLEEWVPPAKKLDRAAALAELTRRYFASHGPATVADFRWWSGLKATEARAGLEAVSSGLRREKIGVRDFWMAADAQVPELPAQEVQLLPGFDEYLLGYKDRGAVLDARHAQKIVPGSNGMFLATVVVNGRVAGTWKRVLGKKAVVITPTAFGRFSRTEQRALELAAEQYARFVRLPAEMREG